MRGILRWSMVSIVLVLGIAVASGATAAQVTNTFTNFGGDGIGTIQFNADQSGLTVYWSYAPFSQGTEPGVNTRTAQAVVGDPSGNRYEVRFNDTTGRLEPGNDLYYRIDTLPVSRMTIAGPKNVDRNPPGDIRNFTVASRTPSSVTLTWTVPGNDGTFNGQDFGGVPIVHLGYRTGSGAWSSAAECDTTPEPSYSASGFPNIGQTATVTVSGLQPGTTYVFCAVAKDIVNRSAGFTSTTATTDAPPPDTQAPEAPTNLVVEEATPTSGRIAWTAPSDNVGVTRFDVRYRSNAATPLAEADWSNATALSVSIAALPGSRHSFSFGSLTADTPYAAGVKACDAAGNCSSIASVTFRTMPAPPGGCASWTPGTRPMAINDFRAVPGPGAQVVWTVPAGVQQYEARFSPNPIFDSNLGVLLGMSPSPPTTLCGGLTTIITLSGIPPATTGYVVIRAINSAGATLSNPITTPIGGGPSVDAQAPTTIGSLTATNLTLSSATLNWIAPTDNIAVTRYEIRYRQGSTSPITEPEWISATPVSHSLGPVAPNTPQSYLLGALAADTAYAVGVKACDAAGNCSGIASATFRTMTGGTPGGTPGGPDTQPPGIPTGLAAEETTGAYTRIAWIEPADNVAVTSYNVRYRQGTSFADVDWSAAAATPTVPSTVSAGDRVTTVFGSLLPNTDYAAGVKACDAAGNCSGIAAVTFRTQGTTGAGTGTIPTGTSTITGIVRRPDGVTPAVGIPVSLRVADSSARRDMTTGADGRYTFVAIAPGAYRVELGVGLPPTAEYSWPPSIPTTVATSQTVTVDVTLNPPTTSGGGTGGSGGGAAACTAWAAGSRPGAITDLHVMSSSQTPELMWFIPPGVTSYELRYATTGFSESTVDAATSIGAFASAPPVTPCGTSTPNVGITGFTPGTTYYVALRAVNSAGSTLSNLIRITPSTSGGTTTGGTGGATGGTTTGGGNLRVIVRDPTGALLSGAAVDVRYPAGYPSNRLTTDAGGVAFFPSLSPGSYTVEVTPPSARTDLSRTTTSGVPVTAGATVDHATTLPVVGTVPPSPTTTTTPSPTPTPTPGSVSMGSICGTVVDADRQPLAGVTVGLQRRSNAAYGIGMTATTDASGRYCFPDLGPGEYGVGALTPPHRTDLGGAGLGIVTVVSGGQAVYDVTFGRASTPVPVPTPAGPVPVPTTPSTPLTPVPPSVTPAPLPALEQCIRDAFGEAKYQRMKSGRDKPSGGEYERVRHCFALSVIVDQRQIPTTGVPPTPGRPIVIVSPLMPVVGPPIPPPEFAETCEVRELPRVRQGLKNLGRELGRIEREADRLRRQKVEVPTDFGIVLGRAKELLGKVQAATTCEDAFELGSEIPDLMEQLRTSLDRISRLRFAPKALAAYNSAVRQFASRVTSGLRRIARSGIEVADLRDRLTTAQKELTECRTSATDALRELDPELFEESMRTCAELLDEHRELEEHVQAIANVRGFLVGRVNATLQRANRLILDLRRQRRDVAEIQRFVRELRAVRDEVLKKVRANQIDRDALVDALLPVIDAFGNLDDAFEQARGTSTYEELIGPRTPAVRAPTLQRPVEEFFRRSGAEER